MTTESRYDELCREFPLRPIRHDASNNRAIDIIERLTDHPSSLTQDEQDYLEVISLLVHEYEQVHHPRPRLAGAELLRALLDANGMSQYQLSHETGLPQATISEIMTGKRSITPRVREVLGKR